jgi:hypothetical protein
MVKQPKRHELKSQLIAWPMQVSTHSFKAQLAADKLNAGFLHGSSSSWSSRFTQHYTTAAEPHHEVHEAQVA